jgi:polyphosphate kinase 2 (PPK2 family)
VQLNAAGIDVGADTHSGARIIIVFEGRDAAGKGGVIKRITERTSPRVFRVVALPAPSERERSQIYFQRYTFSTFRRRGRSSSSTAVGHNRLGVERVMGYCTDEEYERFLRVCPGFERDTVESGVQLIKYWFEVSKDVQTKRFQDRIEDPVKIWKLSPSGTIPDRLPRPRYLRPPPGRGARHRFARD